MHTDAHRRAQAARDRDLDRAASAGANPPQGSGGPVAENGTRSDGQDDRHPPPSRESDAVADRVDALMHSMQPAALQPVSDRTPSDPEGSELPPRDDPVLPLRERGDLGVHCGETYIRAPMTGLIGGLIGHRAQRGARSVTVGPRNVAVQRTYTGVPMCTHS